MENLRSQTRSNEVTREEECLEDAAWLLPGPEQQRKKLTIEATVWKELSGQTDQLGWEQKKKSEMDLKANRHMEQEHKYFLARCMRRVREKAGSQTLQKLFKDFF